MPRVSVVVPVYNSAEFLEECVDGILDQHFQDFELILVDDGSTDRSPVILQKYEEQPKVSIVRLPNNLGLGAARNVGTSMATGDYIAYIDSDDVVEEFYLEHLVYGALNYNADVVQAWVQILKKEHGEWQKKQHGYYQEEPKLYPADKIERMAKLSQGHYQVEAHHKLIRHDLIKQHGLRFELYTGEDLCYILQLLYYAKTVVFMPSVQYHYRINDQGLMATSSDERAKKAIWSLVRGAKLWDWYLAKMPDLDKTLKMRLRFYFIENMLKTNVRNACRKVEKEKTYNFAADAFYQEAPAEAGLLLLLFRDFVLG